MPIVQESSRRRRPWPVRLLVAGDLVVAPGGVMAALALPWIAYEISGLAWLGAVVLGAEALPPLLGRRTSEYLSRYLKPRGLVAVADAVRAVLMAIVVACFLAGVLAPWILLAIALCMGVAIVPQYAAQRALGTAHCRDESDVSWMAGWFTATWHLSLLAGPPAAAAAMAFGGAPLALGLYSGAFAVSAVLAILVPEPPPVPAAVGDEAAAGNPAARVPVPRGSRRDWRAVLHGTVLVDAANGALLVAWLPAVLIAAGAGPGLAATALAAVGAAGLVASWVVMRWRIGPHALRLVALACTALAALLLAAGAEPWTAIPAGGLFGIAATTIITAAHVVIGRMPEPEQLDAHATLAQWCQATMPLGYGAAALVVWLGQAWILPLAVAALVVTVGRSGRDEGGPGELVRLPSPTAAQEGAA